MSQRISSQSQFEEAIKAYISEGITSPIEIAKLLGARGCICSAVAVERYLQSKTEVSHEKD